MPIPTCPLWCPNTKRLLRLGLHGWRADLHEGRLPTDPAKREGGPFRELSLTERTDDELLENSVMLLDDLINAAECAVLVAATDTWCDSVPDSVNDETGEKMELHRVPPRRYQPQRRVPRAGVHNLEPRAVASPAYEA